MTGVNLQNPAEGSAARKRQHVAWFIVLAVIGVLLVVRAVVGTSVATSAETPDKTRTLHVFGTAYVEREEKRFVKIDPKDAAATAAVPAVAPAAADAGAKAAAKEAKKPGPEWKTPAPGQKATIEWVEWKPVTPTAYVEADAANASQDKIQFSWAGTLGIWTAAFFTLAVLSFLVRDNPAYKFTESIVVGVSAAYWMTVAFWDTMVPKLLGSLLPTQTKLHLMPALEQTDWDPLALIPLVLGVLLLCRLNRKASWLGVFPLAFIVGTFAGLKFVQFIEADLLAQVATMFKPLLVVKHEAVAAAGAVAGAAAPAIDWPGSVGGTVSALLIFVGVLSVLVYFFFSLEHKGITGRTARLGIWYLMITFGASFGFTVMGRIALLAARFEFLFDDWLWLVDPRNRH